MQSVKWPRRCRRRLVDVGLSSGQCRVVGPNTLAAVHVLFLGIFRGFLSSAGYAACMVGCHFSIGCLVFDGCSGVWVIFFGFYDFFDVIDWCDLNLVFFFFTNYVFLYQLIKILKALEWLPITVESDKYFPVHLY